MSFTFDDIAKFPLPGVAVPSNYTFTKDGALLYLNRSITSSKQQLYKFDCTTGEESLLLGASSTIGVEEKNLSAEEELRRQRARMLATGITHFSYNKETDQIIVPINNNVYLLEKNNNLKLLTENAITPKFTPNGKAIGYVQASELFLLHLENNSEPIQLTFGARENGKTNGLAEYIAQEELERSDGFWFSPDSLHVAYCEVDETIIPEYTIVHQGKEDGVTNEYHRYPFAGCANAIVKLGVLNLETKQTTWMKLNYEDEEMEEIYVARVFWWTNGNLGAEILNRQQSRLDVVEFEINSGSFKIIHTEKSKFWINLFGENLHFIEINENEFLWISECSGFSHIYKIDKDNGDKVQLTDGCWEVFEINDYNPNNKTIYFTGNKSNPTEKQFYSVSIDNPCQIKSITNLEGTHDIIVSCEFNYFIDIFSSLSSPPVVRIHNLVSFLNFILFVKLIIFSNFRMIIHHYILFLNQMMVVLMILDFWHLKLYLLKIEMVLLYMVVFINLK